MSKGSEDKCLSPIDNQLGVGRVPLLVIGIPPRLGFDVLVKEIFLFYGSVGWIGPKPMDLDG